uniref:Uncharacterized protein n=1 Tax=Arundo donax TaxID=35708 RepID=A0A0A9GIP6_ARUDO
MICSPREQLRRWTRRVGGPGDPPESRGRGSADPPERRGTAAPTRWTRRRERPRRPAGEKGRAAPRICRRGGAPRLRPLVGDEGAQLRRAPAQEGRRGSGTVGEAERRRIGFRCGQISRTPCTARRIPVRSRSLRRRLDLEVSLPFPDH